MSSPAPRAPRHQPDESHITERPITFTPVSVAIADVAAGKPVVVVDEDGAVEEGDLVFAAEVATPELVAFMVRHTSGYVCVPLDKEACGRLDLPLMAAASAGPSDAGYTVTVDARAGIGTGISASDRATTIRLLANPTTRAQELTRPGHVVPKLTREGGVLRRPAVAEAAVDLARLAGLRPAAVSATIVSQRDAKAMATTAELRSFADDHGLALISITDIVAWRRERETCIERVAEARIPTRYGHFRAICYQNIYDATQHIAMVCGEVDDKHSGSAPLVRVHAECVFGDLFGAESCSCAAHLDSAMEAVAKDGHGVVLYMRNGGSNGSVPPSPHTRPADARDYGIGAQILADLGIRSMRLLTDNPRKRSALAGYGLTAVGHVPLSADTAVDDRSFLSAGIGAAAPGCTDTGAV